MELIVVKNKREMAKKAALMISELIRKKPDAVLEVASGKTAVSVYKELVNLYKKKKIDFSKVKTFNLDELANLSYNDPGSYHYYMNKNLFDKVNIQKQNTHFPQSNGKKYEQEIKKAGEVDFALLGLGTNGHIAFNEPDSSFKSLTRTVINSNGKKAYTVGIKTILKSRKIILIASGAKKADAIYCAVKGPISEKCPASILRKHKNTMFIVDKKAAKKL